MTSTSSIAQFDLAPEQGQGEEPHGNASSTPNSLRWITAHIGHGLGPRAHQAFGNCGVEDLMPGGVCTGAPAPVRIARAAARGNRRGWAVCRQRDGSLALCRTSPRSSAGTRTSLNVRCSPTDNQRGARRARTAPCERTRDKVGAADRESQEVASRRNIRTAFFCSRYGRLDAPYVIVVADCAEQVATHRKGVRDALIEAVFLGMRCSSHHPRATM